MPVLHRSHQRGKHDEPGIVQPGSVVRSRRGCADPNSRKGDTYHHEEHANHNGQVCRHLVQQTTDTVCAISIPQFLEPAEQHIVEEIFDEERPEISTDLPLDDNLIKDAAGFVENYDKIVTPAIAGAIGAQKYSDLMVNGKGVMFGSGETWINGICKKGSADCSEFEVKVVAIQPGAS